MKTPPLPGSRIAQQRISVLKAPDSGRVVLGTSEPDEDDRRARAIERWSPDAVSPRRQPLATIDQPLPVRLQTLLSYRIDPYWSVRLDGGPSQPPASRRQATEPVQARLDIGIGFDVDLG